MHGTTVGLNAFLERKGTRLLLVMTAGLRDAYSIARHDRKELYALRYPSRSGSCRGATSSRSSSACAGTARSRPRSIGRVSSRCSRVSAKRTSRRSRSASSTRTSIPSHELELRDLLLAEFPELSITLSHEIAREWREYERASSAVLERVHRAAGRAAISARSSASSASSRSRARSTSCSRTAASPRRAERAGGADPDAALGAGRRDDGRRGTRAVDRPAQPALHRHGRHVVRPQPRRRRLSRPSRPRRELEGLPVLMPLVDIHTIGAGGGIARLARGRRAARRAAERRRRSRAGVLRPRRHPADRHGRQPLSRPARLRATSSAAGWRSTRTRPSGRSRRSPPRSA